MTDARPFTCVHCGAARPRDDAPCPSCGKPRWWHKTRDPAEFTASVTEAQELDARRFAPRPPKGD